MINTGVLASIWKIFCPRTSCKFLIPLKLRKSTTIEWAKVKREREKKKKKVKRRIGQTSANIYFLWVMLFLCCVQCCRIGMTMHWSWPWAMNKQMYNINIGMRIHGEKHVDCILFPSLFHIPFQFLPKLLYFWSFNVWILLIKYSTLCTFS